MILEVKNKKDFITDLKRAEELKMGIAVFVEMPDLEVPEMIANPYQNLKAKIAYYEKAYDENMQLKANKEIKITRLMIDTEGEQE